MTGDWTQLGMANLAARVRELSESLDVVTGRLSSLGEDVIGLGEDVDCLMAERAETGAALSRHDRELRELTATVKRLATQVTWVEQHIRSSGAARAVDLDHADTELSALAAASAAGHQAADGLLTPFARAGLETTVADHRDVAVQHRDVVRTLLDACARLVATDPDEREHGQVRADYLAARGAHADAARRVEVLASDVQVAVKGLAADDAERQRRSAVIATGKRAEVELLTRLRTRLAAAVGDGALLPTWLTGVLGPMPPAGAAQRWMDVVAGLLAYRITYGVTDLEDALGELPETVTGYQRRWHVDLARGVRELRR